MAEASFAKGFLATLDTRPVKVSADHVEDPRNFPSRPPYILPRMPKPMSKSKKASLPGQERSITVRLKSLRNPPLDVTLPSQPAATTSILDIKTAASQQTRVPVDKMKLLLNKRPVPDSKVLKDVIEEGSAAVEFSVMVMGGAAAIPVVDEVMSRTGDGTRADDPTGSAALETDEFWNDLKGFLMQRLKDEGEAEKLSALFKSSWTSSK